MKFLLFPILLLISCNHFAQNKDITKDTLQQVKDSALRKVEIEAKFPGGEQMWNQYLQRQVEKHIRKLSKDKKSIGTCEVQFVVSKDGTITNVEALTLKNSLLAKIVVEAVQNGPKWIPAFQNGKIVKAWRRQKIAFSLP